MLAEYYDLARKMLGSKPYPEGRRLPKLDALEKVAEGMGATGITAKTPAELAEALKTAQKLNAEGTTVLIDVHSDMEGKRSRWDR